RWGVLEGAGGLSARGLEAVGVFPLPVLLARRVSEPNAVFSTPVIAPAKPLSAWAPKAVLSQPTLTPQSPNPPMPRLANAPLPPAVLEEPSLTVGVSNGWPPPGVGSVMIYAHATPAARR